MAATSALLTNPAHSKNKNAVVINTDIAIEGLTTNVVDLKCGKDSVFISFTVKNKMNTAGVKAKVTILVNGIDETAAFALNRSFCYTFPRSQSITILAKAAIKQPWAVPSNPVITLLAEACNFEGGVIQFHETNAANNKQEIRDPRLHNVVLSQPYCECGFLNEIIDTSGQYILTGNIKLNNTGTLSAPAYFSASNNLAPVLSKEYAIVLKFKFAGIENSVPLYNIIFAANGLMLTETITSNQPLLTNNNLTFASGTNIPEQKWMIKKNSNGSYSFACKSSLTNCFVLGKQALYASSLQNPFLNATLVTTSINEDKYTQFELIKLQ